MVYIANAYAPELLGKTPDERGQMDMIYDKMKHLKAETHTKCFTSSDKSAIGVSAKEGIMPFVNFLG